MVDLSDGFGPFTMEFVQPHMTACMTNLDFDVNNLFVVKDYTRELGMRVPVPRLTLRELIPQIWRKEFNVMCIQDHIMPRRSSSYP